MKDKESEEEKRARKCGDYFTPFGKLQKEATMENLNKTSKEEALKKSRLIKGGKK